MASTATATGLHTGNQINSEVGDDPNKLWTIVYMSAATRLLNEDEINSLLEQARTCNERDRITGMLLYAEGSFVQALEGPREQVVDCYNRIAADSRHGNCFKLLDTAVEARSFSDWRMGYKIVLQQEFTDNIPDFQDILQTGKLPTNSEPMSSRQRSVWTLLSSFATTNQSRLPTSDD